MLAATMRRSLPVLLATVAFTLGGPDAEAADKAKKRLHHKVEQSILYVNMKLPERAKEELSKLVETEPGKSDGITWLALSRSHYALKDLDAAGLALERAKGLGVQEHIDKRKWAKTYFTTISELVGGVRIRDAGCDQVRFSARLATPMVNREKRALLEALPGWRNKEFERRTDQPFFLPAGKFRLGETKVKIIPGEVTSVTAKELQAKCTELPKVAAASTGEQSEAGGVTGKAPPPAGPRQSGGFLSDNWLWLVLGAVAVAGGTTAAVVVASGDSGPDRFRQVF